jgi:hypothetical protein
MVLQDAEPLCAFARFCDNAGTIWVLIERTDDRDVREIVAYEGTHCPSGRLVVSDRKNGKVFEPPLEPSIGLVEDPLKSAADRFGCAAAFASNPPTALPTKSAIASRCVDVAHPQTNHFVMANTRQSASKTAYDFTGLPKGVENEGFYEVPA